MSRIQTQEEYEDALGSIHKLWDAKLGSPEFRALDALAQRVDSYEKSQWLLGVPDPVSAIKFHMRQKDLNLTDFADLIGSPLHAFEVLNKKRKLTFPMVWKLNKFWGIPTESLIGSRVS